MIASLVLSAVVVYACLVLLGRQIGFTLSLAGIAGFIVSIGITADSFVVYFERLKDEIREGRTLRSAVPRAWVRARRTILSADAVSFLAAAILYVLAIGDVKGFAFTLGMSTVLDLVVVFLFTHPLMAVLSRFKSLRQQPVLRPRPGRAHPPAAQPRPAARELATAGAAPAPAPRTGAPHDPRRQPRARRRATVPVGTDADEQQDADEVLADAAAAADEEALADAGLPREAAPTGAGGDPPRAAERRSRSHRLYNGEAGLDVVGHSRLIYKITAVVVLLCLAVDRLPRLQLRHRLRRRQQLPAARAPTEQLEEVREAAEDAGAEVASAQIVGGNTILLRTEQLDTEDERAVVEAVADAAGRRPGRGQRRGGQRRVGPGHHRPGADRPRRLPGRRDRLPGAALPAEDGRRRDRRAGARHHRHRRRLLADRLRGDAVDGDRLPHHPRLLALRHRRRLRQGRRERQGPRARPPA